MRLSKLSLLLFLCISSSFIFAAQKQKQSPAKPSQNQTPTVPTKTVEAKPPAEKVVPKADDQWALLIGISNYQGAIQKLTYPKSDALAIKDLLLKSANFRDDHIRLLTDEGQGDARATKQGIFNAIDAMASQVQTGHQVIVFLAGHGIVRGLGAEAKSYFLPVDADATSKESLEQTGVELGELSRKLAALKASQFTIFVDACREDPFPGRGIKGNTMTDVMTRGLRVVPAQTSANSNNPTSVVFYACQIGERAYEDSQLEHGVFTYFILSGIKEVANRPDGRVEAGYLASYLRDNVQKWSSEFQKRAKYPVEQTPTMVATEVRGPIVIVKLPSLAKDVTSPANGKISLVTSPEGATVTINGQAGGAAPMQKEFAAGEYQIRAEMQGFQPAETKINLVGGIQQEVTITLKPTTANASYEKGVQFEAQGLMPQALISYEQALREDPNSVAVYGRLAEAYIASARYRDAVDLLTTATEKNPDNMMLLANRSRALSAWARVEETQDLSTNSRPGKAVKYKDARKEAVKAAELAAQKAPNLVEANLALGYAYTLDEKDRQKAVPAFVRASTIAPENAETYFGAGYSYRLLRQYPQAIPQLKKALSLRSDYYEAHRELAYCHHATGNTDEAIKEYNTATGYRSETNDKGEMAGNHLALSALYTEKGQQVGGAEGEQISAAGKGYASEARDYDPTLKAALKVLSDTGLSSRMQSYLPSEVRSLINTRSVDIPGVPGNIKLPFPKKRPF